MESMGNILRNSNPLKTSGKTDSAPPSPPSNDREDAIRALIIRMYLSCRKDSPSPEVLDYEVQIALEDLAEIPDRLLKDSFSEAVAASDGFLPGNGKIISAYRGKRGDQFEEAQKAIRMQNTALYLGAPGAGLPSDEERERIAAEMAAIAARLAEGLPE